MQAGKKSILLVVNGFGVGGGELKLLELAQRLNRDKYDISIVSVGQGGALEEHFRALGLPVEVLKKCCGFDLSLPVRLAGCMRKYRTDLVMSTLFYADIMAALATCLYRPGVLVSWEVITGRLSGYQKWAYRRLARRFTHVVAVSNSIHPFIIRDRGQNPQALSTIYYGVDLDKFRPAPRTTPSTGVCFGTVARLVHQKGHTHLLKAIPAVLAQHPGARWHFAGDGDLRPALQAQAGALGIAAAVEFLGRRDDVQRLLEAFDVFILPSLWEGFPNVVLEAMAAGKPVIATAVEGTVELVVEGETGLLVAKEEPEALARAMNRLAADAELRARMGRAGRQRVESHFTVQHQVAEFEALFDRLLDECH